MRRLKHKTVTAVRYARLEEVGSLDSNGWPKVFVVLRGAELVVRKMRGGFRLRMGGRAYFLEQQDARDVFGRFVLMTEDEADEKNTCRFTCHACGDWLDGSDRGYGTESGTCRTCREREEDPPEEDPT